MLLVRLIDNFVLTVVLAHGGSTWKNITCGNYEYAYFSVQVKSSVHIPLHRLCMFLANFEKKIMVHNEVHQVSFILADTLS